VITRYNVVGVNGRDCPRCFRVGTLGGTRTHGCTMECSGCAARFRLDNQDPLGPTLEHVTRTEEWNRGARQADDTFCPGCGARGWPRYCPTCERAA
jgi:hypothetical protein